MFCQCKLPYSNSKKYGIPAVQETTCYQSTLKEATSADLADQGRPTNTGNVCLHEKWDRAGKGRGGQNRVAKGVGGTEGEGLGLGLGQIGIAKGEGSAAMVVAKY